MSSSVVYALCSVRKCLFDTLSVLSEVNEEKFGVKSTFKTDMSQYTTTLDVKKLSADQVRREKTCPDVSASDSV